MGKENELSPEKQLLKLIEESSPKEQSSLQEQPVVVKKRNISLLSPKAWQARSSFLKDSLEKYLKGGGFFRVDSKVINKILVVCIFMLVFYFINNLYAGFSRLKHIPDFETEAETTKESLVFQKVSVLKALSFYMEAVRARDIFKMGAVKVPETEEGRKKAASSRLLEAVSNLKLVGISWSNDPDVMIEDTKVQRTYFLKKGQIIDSVNLKLEAVFKDKVVLSSDSEEVELR